MQENTIFWVLVEALMCIPKKLNRDQIATFLVLEKIEKINRRKHKVMSSFLVMILRRPCTFLKGALKWP